MPISHSVEVETGILRVRRWGAVTTQDEEQACKDREGDPQVVPGIPVLVDCTEVEPPDSTETIKYVASCTTQLAAELQCGPVAIVVATEVEFGMARMYMAYTDLAHPNTRVFKSEKDALEWLHDSSKATEDTGVAT